MLGFSKKDDGEISRTNPGYEEVERPTPTLGLVLLFVMFIAGLFFGWRALDNLASIPDKPKDLSYCSAYYAPGYIRGSVVSPNNGPALYQAYNQYYLDSYASCTFNTLENKGGIPALFEERKVAKASYDEVYNQFNAVSNDLSSVRDKISRLTGEYGVGLQEKEVGVINPVFPATVSGEQLVALKAEEARLLAKQSDLKISLDTLQKTTIDPIDAKIRVAYVPVFEEQNKDLRWYDFKVFLLQILFAFPLFYFALYYYLRLHRKNSPYTVILTSVVAVAAVLLLRVVLVWFWGLFLEKVLEVIMEWFAQSELIRTLLFYFGMLLSFAALGGAVYFLQKRVFDPRRVSIRRFRQKQCPQCQTNLDLSGDYCPNCGYKVREACASCGKPRFTGMPHCPSCGNKK